MSLERINNLSLLASIATRAHFRKYLSLLRLTTLSLRLSHILGSLSCTCHTGCLRRIRGFRDPPSQRLGSSLQVLVFKLLTQRSYVAFSVRHEQRAWRVNAGACLCRGAEDDFDRLQGHIGDLSEFSSIEDGASR